MHVATLSASISQQQPLVHHSAPASCQQQSEEDQITTTPSEQREPQSLATEQNHLISNNQQLGMYNIIAT